MEVPQKIKNKTTLRFSNQTTGYLPKEYENTNWIKKMCSIYTMEYYSAIKKNNFTTLAATLTGLEEIMLREISQAEKDNYHMVSLIYGA